MVYLGGSGCSCGLCGYGEMLVLLVVPSCPRGQGYAGVPLAGTGFPANALGITGDGVKEGSFIFEDSSVYCCKLQYMPALVSLPFGTARVSHDSPRTPNVHI